MGAPVTRPVAVVGPVAVASAIVAALQKAGEDATHVTRLAPGDVYAGVVVAEGAREETVMLATAYTKETGKRLVHAGARDSGEAIAAMIEGDPVPGYTPRPEVMAAWRAMPTAHATRTRTDSPELFDRVLVEILADPTITRVALAKKVGVVENKVTNPARIILSDLHIRKESSIGGAVVIDMARIEPPARALGIDPATWLANPRVRVHGDWRPVVSPTPAAPPPTPPPTLPARDEDRHRPRPIVQSPLPAAPPTRVYLFPLRADTDAEIRVPRDVTRAEIDRLCAFLGALVLS